MVNARLTDRDVEPLGQFAHLLDLDLSHNRLTDRGMSHLRALGGLRNFKVNGNQLSPEGQSIVAELISAHSVDASPSSQKSD